MRMAEVDMALIWQNPAATPYTGDADPDYESLLAANRYIRDAAERYPDRFLPAGWVDPKACGIDGALEMAEVLVLEYGFPIVKMNPAQNRYPIDSEPVLAVVDRIVELGAIPAFHYGADTPFTPAGGLERIALRHPDHPLVAAHMGGGGAGYSDAEPLYQESRALGLRCPNIRFLLSTRRDAHTESDLIAYQSAGEPFCRNLCCGSDAPYGRMTWNFGGYRQMFRSLMEGSSHPDPRLRADPRLFTPESVQGYLGGNIARLAAEGCRNILKVNHAA
ncbi:MAG: amidohydrolase family protein [Acidobacteria bacterium]|nr:amidohydrolase family protein [Acidobacteriota bacterium]